MTEKVNYKILTSKKKQKQRTADRQINRQYLMKKEAWMMKKEFWVWDYPFLIQHLMFNEKGFRIFFPPLIIFTVGVQSIY